MVVTAEERKQIREKGYADIGGIPRQRYWTPDGREISAIAAMRTFNRIEDGKVVESGTRDANLDKGWLLQKPDKLKPYCPHCDKWHDTQEEVDKCRDKKRSFVALWDAKARQMKKKEETDIENLKTEVSEIKQDMASIKGMLEQLLKGVQGG